MSLIRPFFVRLTCALLTGLCLLGWVVPPAQAADQTEAAASQTDPDVSWAASTLLDHGVAAGLVAFHSVTPLSAAWLYSVDHYGWLRGLILVSQTAAPQELGLPVVPNWESHDEQGNYNYVARLVGYYLYYQGADGVIYQTTICDPQTARPVFQLPVWSYSIKGDYVFASMGEQDGKMILRFHQGGAAMGHDEAWLFAADGASQRIDEDLHTHIVHGDDFAISTYTGAYCAPGNLYKTPDGEPVGHGIGRRDILYRSAPVLYGQRVYAAGTDAPSQEQDHDLYETDLTTDQTRQINDPTLNIERLSPDRLAEDPEHILYFVGSTRYANGQTGDYALYRLDISKRHPTAKDIERIISFDVSDQLYAFSSDTVYYAKGIANSRRLYRLGQSEPIEPNGRLIYLYNDQDYIIAGFGETAADDTRLLVLDQNGQEVFRSADMAQRPQIDHDRLFYITKDGRSYLVPLQ